MFGKIPENLSNAKIPLTIIIGYNSVGSHRILTILAPFERPYFQLSNGAKITKIR